MAQKYRKKPVEVDAMRFDGTWANLEAIRAWLDYKMGYATDRETGLPVLIRIGLGDRVPRVGVGDYIIRESGGKFWACRPEFFAKTHEPVLEPLAA